MKNKELKKGKESIIGKIIYGFLLFMPLLAILTTCLYAIFNKNAYQSYSDELVESTTQINDNNLITNQVYLINYNESKTSTGYSPIFHYSSISIDWSDYTAVNNDVVTGFRFYPSSTTGILLFDANDTNIAYLSSNSWGNTLKSFTFTYKSIQATNANQPTYDLFLFTYTTKKLDNVFYYSVDKVEQSNLFNWSKTTIIYTGIANTCTQLGITNTFTPMLLAYWLLISVVYILYDIILMILIILHNRIHRLQDSMN